MLLDVSMPGVDGYDVLEVRRERGLAPDMCVVMLSAEDDERSLVRSWALGADAYLTKPVDPEQIAARLRALLGATPARPPSPWAERAAGTRRLRVLIRRWLTLAVAYREC